MLPGSGLEGADEDGGVDPRIVETDIPVHVGTGGAAGGADPADDAAAGQALAQLHVDLRHVAEHADEPLAMVDKDSVAVKEIIPCQNDLACCRRAHRRTGGHGKGASCSPL